MRAVTIEESDDERSIVTPNLRLRFSRRGDRWTHAIDLGPGPEPDEQWPYSIDPARGQWLTLAQAVEWERPMDDLANVVSPVFQELSFQEDAKGATALLVGQAGPHHFSASFRVEDEILWGLEPGTPLESLEGYQTKVEVDVADRCSSPVERLSSTYLIDPPFPCDLLSESPDESGTFPKPHLFWESSHNAKGRHDFSFGNIGAGCERYRLVMRKGVVGYGPWNARLFAGLNPEERTQRYSYSWFHDCTTPRYFEELRRFSPAYDAHVRWCEAERARRDAEHALWKANQRELLKTPEMQEWLQRVGISEKSFLDDD